MSTLLEWQRSMGAQLLAAPLFAAPPPTPPGDASPNERFAIYRHTCLTTLINALRLNFPVVLLLVGDEFFQGAATQFVTAQPPASAYLNDYGASFATFLAQFAPAAGITYLPDVARLEWAVSRALHAPDSASLDVASLTGLNDSQMSAVRFHPRPGLSVLRLDVPADDIWRAVLSGDEAAMAAVRLNDAPVYLLVERGERGPSVQRLTSAAGRFSESLLRGQPLSRALDAADEGCAADGCVADGTGDEINAVLADHLRAGRFMGFSVSGEIEA
jgi:putative DNA-binding protein